MRSRSTAQKNIIAKEMKKMRSFFDAEKLYNQVQKKDPKIGIATVYRYLKNSSEKGEIHSYTCDRKTIYTLDIKNHCHFTCENCGAIKHIKVKKLDFMKEVIKGEVCHFQLDVTGVCDKCQKNM